MTTQTDDRQNLDSVGSVTPVAVIDIGTSSIRMAIAEIRDSGGVRTLESLTRAVSLGRDTFTRGSISKGTIEECVRVLKSYCQKLREYQIRPEQIRVIATSAVREASNRLAFLDRVYIATGIEVEPMDEAEVTRITFHGIQPFLRSETGLASAQTLVIEVGGGSTEVLLVAEGNVAYSHTYRLGSLRLRKTLEAYRMPASKHREIMESKIRRTAQQVREDVPAHGKTELIALGGDMRFAARQLLPDWHPSTLARVPVVTLERLTNKVLSLTDDEIVRKYHLSFPDAETVGPALLAYLMLARELGVANVLVTNTNLRDGLLQELLVRDAWTEESRAQVVRSALDLGQKFDFDEPHAKHVAHLAQKLFQELQAEHQLDSRYELIVYVAALLHEIGSYVSHRGMHKHSMYLIRNSEVFGLGRKNLLLVALVARYHRRASPQSQHEGYATLEREERVAVSKLAAMLRLAIALDESRSQRIETIEVVRDNGRLVISIPYLEDLSLEQLALRQSGSLFEEVFGTPVLLRTARQ